MKRLALIVLGLILARPVLAKPDWTSFSAGLFGAMIAVTMADEINRERNTPPEPPKKDPRTIYIQTCAGYGFTAAWCAQRWDSYDYTQPAQVPPKQ